MNIEYAWKNELEVETEAASVKVLLRDLAKLIAGAIEFFASFSPSLVLNNRTLQDVLDVWPKVM
jgi:hypothetical protein